MYDSLSVARPCVYYQMGLCVKGDDCTYMHDLPAMSYTPRMSGSYIYVTPGAHKFSKRTPSLEVPAAFTPPLQDHVDTGRNAFSNTRILQVLLSKSPYLVINSLPITRSPRNRAYILKQKRTNPVHPMMRRALRPLIRAPVQVSR